MVVPAFAVCILINLGLNCPHRHSVCSCCAPSWSRALELLTHPCVRLVHTGCEGFSLSSLPTPGSDGETPLLLCLAVSRTTLLSAGTDPWLRMLTQAREEASVFRSPAAPRTPPPPHTATLPASERERCRCSLAGWPWQSRWWGSLQLLLSHQFWSHTLGGCKPAEHSGGRGERTRGLPVSTASYTTAGPVGPPQPHTWGLWNLSLLEPVCSGPFQRQEDRERSLALPGSGQSGQTHFPWLVWGAVRGPWGPLSLDWV